MAAQRGKDLLVKLDMTGAGVFETVAGLTRVPHSASVMSSTRLTDTPARYISISDSSTDASRRR